MEADHRNIEECWSKIPIDADIYMFEKNNAIEFPLQHITGYPFFMYHDKDNFNL